MHLRYKNNRSSTIADKHSYSLFVNTLIFFSISLVRSAFVPRPSSRHRVNVHLLHDQRQKADENLSIHQTVWEKDPEWYQKFVVEPLGKEYCQSKWPTIDASENPQRMKRRRQQQEKVHQQQEEKDLKTTLKNETVLKDLKAKDDPSIKANEKKEVISEDIIQEVLDQAFQMEEENVRQGDNFGKANTKKKSRPAKQKEVKRKVEEVARFKAEKKARSQIEEEKRQKAEKEARSKAKEEAKMEAALLTKGKVQQTAQGKARVKSSEEARVKSEEEANSKAEKESKIQARKKIRLEVKEEASRVKAKAKVTKEVEGMRQDQNRDNKKRDAGLSSEDGAKTKGKGKSSRKLKEKKETRTEEIKQDVVNQSLQTNDTTNGEKTIQDKSEEVRILLYRNIGNTLTSIPLFNLTKLGYRAEEIQMLQSDALAVIVNDGISRPRMGLPPQWKMKQGQTNPDIQLVSSQKDAQTLLEADQAKRRRQRAGKTESIADGRRSPRSRKSEENNVNRKNKSVGDDDPSSLGESQRRPRGRGPIPNEDDSGRRGRPQNATEPTRRPRTYEVNNARLERVSQRKRKEEEQRARKMAKDGPQRRSRQRSNFNEDGTRKRIYSAREQLNQKKVATRSDPPPLNSPIWVDMDTFRKLLRTEAELRLRILGEDWAPTVKQESDWRLNLYKDWLWTLHDGVGGSIVPPSRYERARKMRDRKPRPRR